MELVAVIVFFVFLGVIIAQLERERDRLAAENAGLRARLAALAGDQS